MSERKDFYFSSSDGAHSIHAALWPAEGEVRAVVQIVHGLSEYIGRYDGFAKYLNAHGIAVVGHDHLGHGQTARKGEYGYLARKDGWRHLLNDVRTLRVRCEERFPGLPYVLLGHSMGSFVVRNYIIDWPGDVDGVILSGTGQEPGLLVSAGRLLAGLLCLFGQRRKVNPLIVALSLGGYNKQFAPNRTPSDWVCSDEAVVDAYLSDPLCRFVPTVGMFHDMMGGLQYIATEGNLRQMDPSTPVYFFAGENDPVGGNGKGVRKVAGWFRGAGVSDVEVKLYPGGRHEMLNEVNKEAVYADVLDWMERHL